MPPIDLLMQMSCVSDVEEFLNFIDKSSIDARDNIGTWVSQAIGMRSFDEEEWVVDDVEGWALNINKWFFCS